MSDPSVGGNYEVIRKRLLDQAADLSQRAVALNSRRKEVFGGSELALLANERVRTENNGIPRDMVSIAGHLLFGFEVFVGLKSELGVADVLSAHKFERAQTAQPEGQFDLAPVPWEGPLAFLADPTFTKEFKDVFRYNKDAKFAQLRRTETRLLAAVQLSATVTDLKVFRWAIDARGGVTYMDARGDEDNVTPRSHDFSWVVCGREQQVMGKFPHYNILGEVFVETTGGDLTIKVENNTATGEGVFREPVDDPNQTLDDAEVAYARVGALILLRVKPFREKQQRYIVYDTRNRRAARIDAIGQSCVALPDNHGIVFPGGIYLDTGERKVFEGDVSAMAFERTILSPNGEDVAYVYYRADDGQYVILPYNRIRKEADQLIRCNGYSLFPDGTMAVFRASHEATRVHPIQIWRTPFTTAEHAASQAGDGSYLSKVGNADLVRGISDVFALTRLAQKDEPTRRSYDDLVRDIGRLTDAYHWLGHVETGDLLSAIQVLKKTAELVLDEFDKHEAIRARAKEATDTSATKLSTLDKSLVTDDMKDVDAYLAAFTQIRALRGEIIALRELRGVEATRVDELEAKGTALFDRVSRACVTLLLGRDAFAELVARLEGVIKSTEATEKAQGLLAIEADLNTVQGGLTLLSEFVSALPIEDVTARTKILEGVSAAFGQLNRARATFSARKKELTGKEGRAEFSVQFKLFSQAVGGALAVCDTPERCDHELSRLMLSLGELESKFSEFDEFAVELADKRQEVQDALAARREQLQAERQKRASNLAQAAERVLAGIVRRAQGFTTVDELNAYFASDPTIQKVHEFQRELGRIGDTVRADELLAKLKSARQDAQRALRDKTDLLSEGAIKFGNARFSVNTQPVELTLVPREGGLFLHLTATDFYEPLEDAGLFAARDLWDQTLPSESPAVYRAEFLATQMYLAAVSGESGLSLGALRLPVPQAGETESHWLRAVRSFAETRIDEGYERGVHDVDAALILERLVSLDATVGLLRYAASDRALAVFFWVGLVEEAQDLLRRRARSALRVQAELGDPSSMRELATELAEPLVTLAENLGLGAASTTARSAAAYLLAELGRGTRFTTTREAVVLARLVREEWEALGCTREVQNDLLLFPRFDALATARSYVDALLRRDAHAELRPFALEAAVLLVTEGKLEREESSAVTRMEVTGLLGRHARVVDRALSVALDEMIPRVETFMVETLPRYRAYRKLRGEVLDRERQRLRLAEFAPRVLSSFVRNRLIDEVYLPLIGNNLAKQIGEVSEKKRTDLMGMLLLISPPGYGKTTLMEYVASKLGLVFMKVNGPSLGHDVTSLDPAEVKSATARQEVEKINLAFEMGNNVMLYLDDIQHTSAELLQKFISLCDGQRRVEGVWRGKSRTYDLRGKKFCVVMAGNPYTESGERFRIPDMLANRADTYNLGDILGGKEDLFALSYLENALTSNPVLAPLASRDPKDVHRLIAMARGEEVPLTDLAHGYSAAEAEDIARVFARLLKVQRTLLAVNQEYIASASQDDSFRAEPPFKLQGSYRNMNKLTEKVASAMNDDELEQLIDDHYRGEAQTLTTGAEQNLLKLGALRGRLSDTQRARWETIKTEYLRKRRMGGAEDDPITRVTGTLSGLDAELKNIGDALKQGLARGKDHEREADERARKLAETLTALGQSFQRMSNPRVDLQVQDSASELATVMREHSALLSQAVGALAGSLAKSMHQAAAASHVHHAHAGNPSTAQQSYAAAHAGAPSTQPINGEVLSRLDFLAQAVKRLEERLRAPLAGAGGPLVYEVALSASSQSNFYRGLTGNDVVRDGGLFVATYEKLPPLGARVQVRLAFPGGVQADVEGPVVSRQDLVGEDGTELVPGFAIRLERLNNDTYALITQFARQREPLLRE